MRLEIIVGLFLILVLAGYAQAEIITISLGDKCELTQVADFGSDPGIEKLTVITTTSTGKYHVGTKVPSWAFSSRITGSTDGTTWTLGPTAGTGISGGEIDSISPASSGGVWAMNWYDSATSTDRVINGDESTAANSTTETQTMGKRDVRYHYTSNSYQIILLLNRNSNVLRWYDPANGAIVSYATFPDATKIYELASYSDGYSFVLGGNASNQAKIYRGSNYSLSNPTLVASMNGTPTKFIKHGNTYYLFVMNGPNMDIYTSSNNGSSFTLWQTQPFPTMLGVARTTTGIMGIHYNLPYWYKPGAPHPDGLVFANNFKINSITHSSTDDSFYVTAYSTKTIHRLRCNLIPILDVGEDSNQSNSGAYTHTFDVNHVDGDAISPTYTWTQLNGPIAAFTNPNVKNASVTFSTTGTYVFRLTVNDSRLPANPKYDDITINFTNTPPSSNNPPVLGNASVSTPCYTNMPCTASFTATDPENNPLTYEWNSFPSSFTQLDGRYTTAFTFTPTETGNFPIQYRANDGINNVIQSLNVLVEEAPAQNQSNAAIMVNLGNDLNLSNEEEINHELIATITSSTANTLNYNWEIVSGNLSNAFLQPPEEELNKRTIRLIQTGSYRVRLTLTDSITSESAHDEILIQFTREPNTPTPNNPSVSPTTAPANIPPPSTPPAGTPTTNPITPETISTQGNVDEIVELNPNWGEAIENQPQIQYQWRQTSGKPVQIQGENLPNPTVLSSEAGSLEFEGIALDAQGTILARKKITLNLIKGNIQTTNSTPLAASDSGNNLLMVAGVILAIVVLGIIGYTKFIHHSAPKTKKN